MAWKRRLLVAPSAAIALLATGLAGPTATAVQPAEGQAARKSSTVTLITGDKVTITPRGSSWGVQIQPAHGRSPSPAGFFRQAGPQGVTVIPTAALPLIRSGVLDKALFDVTGLVRQGLDDAHSRELPLLVRSSGDKGAAGATAGIGRVTRQLPAAGLTAVTATKGDDMLAAVTDTRPAGGARLTGGLTKIWLNGRAKPTLDVSVRQVGAPGAWAAGHTGAGGKVAVLDSGYDAGHPDLAGIVKAAKSFVDDGLGMKDVVGHGTHVASIAAGRGTASGGSYTGVAKGANLLIGKVCDPSGCPFDSIIAGMQWAADNGAKVVNISLGAGPSDGTDPLSQEVDRISAASGTLFVVAAGNDGPAGLVSAPAAADAALAVASVTKQDTLSEFSSVGPRVGDFALKPDLAGPGSDIIAARAEGTLDDQAVDSSYARLSGTSMATPHVAGAAAILAAQHPDWRGDKLKAALMNSAHPVEDAAVYQQGAGRLDVFQATKQQITTAPASVSFAAILWPNKAAQPQTKQVAYRNDSNAAVTMSLQLDVRDSTGRPAPAGMFRTNATTVTVPAHGQAMATVTVDPSAGGSGPVGMYGGRLVATSADGSTAVRTPIGVYKEPESYDLTMKMTDRNGAVLTPEDATGMAVVLDLNDDANRFFPVLSGEKLRLPTRRYAIFTLVMTPIPGRVEPSVTSDARPEVELRSNKIISVDARKGHRTNLQLDAKDAQVQDGTAGMLLQNSKVTAGLLTTLAREQFAVPTQGKSADVLYYTRAALDRQPVRLKVTAPEAFHVPVGWLRGTAKFVGNKALEAVDVGHARPDEITGKQLQGKLAIFTLSAGEGDLINERVKQLADAGAAAALFHYTEDVGISTDPATIPLAYADDASAGRLVNLTGAKVTLTGYGPSPYRYELALPHTGGIPASLTYRLRNQDLAAVQATYHALVGGGVAYHDTSSTAGKFDLSSQIGSAVVRLPAQRIEYYSAGQVEWQSGVRVAPDIEGGPEHGYQDEPHTYRRGEKSSTEWNKPVAGPGFAAMNWRDEQRPIPAFRNGNTLDAVLPLFTDSDGHIGTVNPSQDFGFADTGETSLYASGRLLARHKTPGEGVFTAPPGVTDYKLTTEVRRNSPAWPLATKVSAQWKFRSSITAQPTPLPLLAIRLNPQLDQFNYAPAGHRFSIPVSVTRQPGSTGGEITLTKVQVSYDDGNRWQPVSLAKTGPGWRATLIHPASGFVSLRSTATDAQGNEVTQTTIRAYRLK